jgi:hypothetical protein
LLRIHFANVHLGNLAYDSEGGRFKPTAYVAAPAPTTDKNARPKRLVAPKHDEPSSYLLPKLNRPRKQQDFSAQVWTGII